MPYLGNVPSSFNVGTNNIDNDAITTEKIAAGAVVNADVNAAAAIAGTKISPDFGSQNILTTGTSTAASFSPSSSSVPTNGFYLPSANNLAISTNGTGRLFVDSAGNVGLGTGSPIAPLHVVGNVRANQFIPLTDSAAAPGLCVAVETDTGFFRPAGDTIAIATGGSEIARFTSAGRLGLGTSSPIALLDVRGNVYLAGNGTSRQTIAAVTTGGSFETGVEASTGGAVFTGSSAYAGVIGTQNATSLQFGSNGAIRATLDSSGRLGIGTTSPGTSLDVNGKLRLSSTEDSQLEWVTGAQTWRSNVVSGGKWYLYDVTNAKFPLDVSANSTCKLDINTSHVAFTTNASERARIDSSGRLLVGTSTARTNFNGNVTTLQIESTNSFSSGLSVVSNRSSADANWPAHIRLGRSGATTLGSNTVVASGNSLGSINFSGADGTNFIDAAAIFAQVDGTPGANDMPGRLVFSTTADGASGPTERMRLDSSGRLGLGTSAPAGKAMILGSDTTSFGTITNGALNLGTTNGTTNGRYVNLNFGYDTGATNAPASIGFTYTAQTGTGAGSLQFGTRSVTTDTAPDVRMTITSAGNVGIGTTSPSELLSLNSSSSNAAVSIRTGGASFNSVVKFNADDTNYAGIGLENTALVMRCSNSSTPTERARIDSSGRLLVGTSTARANFFNATATTQLQIEKAGGGGGVSVVSDSVGDDPAILILAKSNNASLGGNTVVAADNFLGTVAFHGNDGTEFVDAARISCYVDGTPGANDMPGRLVFSTTADGASSPTERMRIRSDGNIGFFNTPGIYPNTDNGASVGFSGNRWSAVYAVNGTIQTSDVREKIEVASSVLGSNFIKALRPVSYKWIEGGKQDSGGRDEDGNYIYKSVPGERTHWGFIAQEVKEAIDAAGVDFGGWVLTDKDDPDSQQALRYDQFIAPLTKALQEALAEIDVLKAKVAALEAS